MSVKQTNFSWLDDERYLVALKDALAKIIAGSKEAVNESDMSSFFQSHLFSILKTFAGIEPKFNNETKVIVINDNEDHVSRGRVDAIVNNLIIEYKHYSKLQTKDNQFKALSQVKRYMRSMYKLNKVKYDAIVTDGVRISYLSFKGEEIMSSSFRQLSERDLDMIVRAIISVDKKRYAPKNIVMDFAIQEGTDSISRRLARELYDVLTYKSTAKTEMLFHEWQTLMHFSDADDQGKSNDISKRRSELSKIFQYSIETAHQERKAIFALQTAYSIVVKMIACNVLDTVVSNTGKISYYDLCNSTSRKLQEFMEYMENGYTYRNNSVTNLLEGDYFSWYSDEQQWSDRIWECIKPIVNTIGDYSAFSFNVSYDPIDVFKDLYMAMMPKSLRHSMGEYFTPQWLADYVVSETITMVEGQDDWKAIDPCCGSGIFLISLIRQIVGDRKIVDMLDQEKAGIVNTILHRVHGIDINPLSVLSARVGYYLALLPFGMLQNAEIPVYLGDSAITPLQIEIDGIKCYKYTVSNEKSPFDVVFPVRFVNSSSFCDNICKLQRFAHSANPEVLCEAIMMNYNEEEKSSPALRTHTQIMAGSLIKLHESNCDGIWIRIISNFMQIARLSEFDIIVGNPPWVKWEHLPAAYAERIKRECDIRHIFFNDGGRFGGTQLNICALIANVTAANWLKEGGVLAFLMPDSIMSQNSYEEFRNFYLDFESGRRLFLQKTDKWTPPLRPFRYDDVAVSQDFNTYYFAHREVDYKKGIPVKEITRKKGIHDSVINAYSSYSQVREYLVFNELKAAQISSDTTVFTYVSQSFDLSKIVGDNKYKSRTGVEMTPQEIFMLSGVGESSKENCYRFRKKEFSNAKYVVTDTPSSGWDLPYHYIYPMLSAPNITPFHYDTANEFCIIPYDKDNLKKPLSEKKMLEKAALLYEYLLRHKKLIDKQSDKSKEMRLGDEFYALSKLGEYTFAPYIVAVRDNTRFCATVVKQTDTPWGEKKQTICVKHNMIISQRADKVFICEDEAYYICGILNSDIVVEYMHSTFKKNGFSLNKAKFALPLYNASDEFHKRIVTLSKEASDIHDNGRISAICSEISQIYLKICREKDDEQG